MDALVTERYLLDWDESDVHAWLASLGHAQYERQIRGMYAPGIMTLQCGAEELMASQRTQYVAIRSALLILNP